MKVGEADGANFSRPASARSRSASMSMKSASLLEHVINAHGGLEQWQRLEQLAIYHRSGGFAFAAKLQGRRLAPRLARVSTSRQRIELTPYPPGDRGVFDRGAVRIETNAGRIIAQRPDGAASIHSWRSRLWWDKLDLLYFTGSALWTYIATPFIFATPGFEVQELDPWTEGANVWNRLAVTFPPEIRTHARRQIFYFDADGLLRRLDYTAEEFGKRARAAHFCSDHREFAGLVFPTRRRVFLRRRNGRPRPLPLLIWIDIDAIEVGPGRERP